MLVLQMRKYCEKTICPELAGSYLPAVADKHPVHPVVNPGSYLPAVADKHPVHPVVNLRITSRSPNFSARSAARSKGLAPNLPALSRRQERLQESGTNDGSWIWR